ncbi:MAG: FAD-binding protein [Candidatus Limnocylindria bacterium]
MVARVPALVVRPTSAQEVAAAVRFARDCGLLLDVKKTSSLTGAPITERAVTLDLSGMRRITVELGARRAHVGRGCLLGEVDRAVRSTGSPPCSPPPTPRSASAVSLAVSAGRPMTSTRSRSSPRTASSASPTATRTPTCFGRSGRVPATSASSRG